MSGPCRHCSKKHNTLLHNHNNISSSNNLHTNSSSNNLHTHTLTNIETPSHTLSVMNNNNNCHVLLSTAVIEISDIFGKYHNARALLDSGSQHCFVTQSLCDILHAKVIQSTLEIHGVGNSVTSSTQACELEIKSRLSSYTTRINCYILEQITSSLPALCHVPAALNIPNNIQLADPDFLEPAQIDLLIGADKFWDLLADGRIRLPAGPYAQNTKLGWVISGPIHNTNRGRQSSCNFTHSLDETLKFRELNELVQPEDTHTDDKERACENHFLQSTTRTGEGRFCVASPCKQSAERLGESRPQAERRFYH